MFDDAWLAAREAKNAQDFKSGKVTRRLKCAVQGGRGLGGTSPFSDTPKGTKKKRQTGSRSEDVNYHALALVKLSNNPDLLKGNQEHYEQVRIFDHFYRSNRSLYDHLHSTPNGGHRSSKTAGAMADEGQKRGYPDITLDLARGAYFGLRVELKVEKGGTVSESQKEWGARLNAQRYLSVVARGHKEAIDIIEQYFDLEQPDYDEILKDAPTLCINH